MMTQWFNVHSRIRSFLSLQFAKQTVQLGSNLFTSIKVSLSLPLFSLQLVLRVIVIVIFRFRCNILSHTSLPSFCCQGESDKVLEAIQIWAKSGRPADGSTDELGQIVEELLQQETSYAEQNAKRFKLVSQALQQNDFEVKVNIIDYLMIPIDKAINKLMKRSEILKAIKFEDFSGFSEAELKVQSVDFFPAVGQWGFRTRYPDWIHEPDESRHFGSPVPERWSISGPHLLSVACFWNVRHLKTPLLASSIISQSPFLCCWAWCGDLCKMYWGISGYFRELSMLHRPWIWQTNSATSLSNRTKHPWVSWLLQSTFSIHLDISWTSP